MRFLYNLRDGGVTHLELGRQSLSWSDHRALVDTSRATLAVANEVAGARRVIEDLRYDVSEVARMIERMEESLSLLLIQQTAIMRKEVELLESISATLRTPRATEAAELIANAGRLLDDGRFERARIAAEEAVVADPTNRRAFLAAAWAHLGLEAPNEARTQFREASQCGRDDDAHSALRLAARLTFLLEGADAALAELAQPVAYPLSALERAATSYDHAIYFAACGRSKQAVGELATAAKGGRGFCIMALTDPILSRETTYTSAASSLISALDELRRELEDRYVALFPTLEAQISVLQTNRAWDDLADDVWQTLESARRELNRYLKVEAESWGFDSLQLAIIESAHRPVAVRRAAAEGEQYIELRQTQVEWLRQHIEQSREFLLTTPEARGGTWIAFTARPKLFSGSFDTAKYTLGPDKTCRITEDFDLAELTLALGVEDSAAYASHKGRRLNRMLSAAAQGGLNHSPHWPYC